MEIRNPWTSYITRSYEQMKTSIVQRLVTKVPEMKDYSQSNLLIVITDIFAGVGELLNYYIDSIFRELFPTTALRLSSAIKIAKQQGYWGQGALPATADLTMTLTDSNTDEPVTSGVDLLIPAGTIFSDTNDYKWTSINTSVIAEGLHTTLTLVKQYQSQGPLTMGTSNGAPNQKYKLGIDYAHGSLSLTVDGVAWELVDTLGFYPGTAKVYMVYLEEDGLMYVLFGDNVNGAIPAVSEIIDITYNSTKGVRGNVITDAIVNLYTPLTLPADTYLKVTNARPTSDGRGVEDIDSLSRSIPRAVYTLDRAVTKKDFEYIAEMAPGIRDALVGYVCGGEVTIYVAPYTTAIASNSQLATTQAYVEARANLTVGDIVVKSAGESRITLELGIHTFPNAIRDNITQQVDQVLLYYYNVDIQDINGSVKLSDIYSLIDPLNNVDYVDILQLYVEPYMRPYGSEVQLTYKFTMTADYTIKDSLKVIYISATNKFAFYRGNTQLVEVSPNISTVISTGLSVNITEDLTIPDGTTWLLKTNPFGTNIFLEDNTIPVLKYYNLIVTYI